MRLNRIEARQPCATKNLTEQTTFCRLRKGVEDTHPRRLQQVRRLNDTRIAADPAML